MKKALILTTVSGFLYKFELENVKLLQKEGYEVHYAANGTQPRYLVEESVKRDSGVIFHPVEIEKSPIKFRQNRNALHQIMEIIRQEQIQVLHCHTPMGGVLGRLAGKQCEEDGITLQVIYTAHGFHFYHGAPPVTAMAYKLVEQYLARYTDILVTINKEDYQHAKKFRLRNNGKVYQIPGVGLDMEHFAPVTDNLRKKARKTLDISEHQLFLLSVGEVNKNKNHRVMIEALHKLQQQGENLDTLRYGICGDGAMREKLHRLVQKYGLDQVIIFYEYQKDVRPYLWAADLFVFPSRREGLGMAALEALSSGLPVIAANNRGSREYIVHGRNGYLCQWNRENDYIRCIRHMQNTSPHVWKQMKLSCRESVEKFDKKYTTEIMTQVYANL